MEKVRLISILLVALISVANADLTLTVNGLDTSMPVEVEPGGDIIIAVAGQTDEQKESYSVTCDTGGKVERLSEPNTTAEQQSPDRYLFTFENKGIVLAVINLTVGDILYYQLDFFRIPDANIIIFGIDRENLSCTPPPEPEQQVSASQTTSSATGGSETPLSGGAGDCNEVLDPNFYPNLNNDQFVNFKDFAILAVNWLESGDELGGDLNESETVDIDDLAILAYYWLANACGPLPEDVFELFKAALLADDLDAALECFTENISRKLRAISGSASAILSANGK